MEFSTSAAIKSVLETFCWPLKYRAMKDLPACIVISQPSRSLLMCTELFDQLLGAPPAGFVAKGILVLGSYAITCNNSRVFFCI